MKKTITLKATLEIDIEGELNTTSYYSSYTDKIIDVIYENMPSVITHIDGDYFITVNTAQIEEIKSPN